MRCATVVIILVAILQQVSYVHSTISTSNDELQKTWFKRLGGAEVSSAATKATEAGVKAAKSPKHVSRTVAGAITAAAATLGIGGGVVAHKYHNDKKQAQKLALGEAPPMKRDIFETDFSMPFDKRGKPVTINKLLVIAGGAAAGGAGVGALGHSLYTKDKARRKEIAAAVADENGLPKMQKRTSSEMDSLPLEKRAKPLTGVQVAAIAGGSMAAGLATGVGIHAMVQDHNTVRKVRNGELPMKRSEKEGEETILLKRSPNRSIFSPKAAGAIGVASFASGAAIGGLGHKAFNTPSHNMPMGMSQGPPQGSAPMERDLIDSEQLVRRSMSMKALGQQAKKFLETKQGHRVAGGVLLTGVAGAGLAAGHVAGHHSERKRIERFQAEQQQGGGGGEGAMMMVKRAGLTEAFGHAGKSLKGGMSALHGKLGNKGLIAAGAGVATIGVVGTSYAAGHHQGKISKIDDHQRSMNPSAGGDSSMMYKRGFLSQHPKTLLAATTGAVGVTLGHIGSTKGKLHEQRKLNGMDRHLSPSSSTSSMGSAAGAEHMGLSGGGAEGRLMKRAVDGKSGQAPTPSEVEEAVKKNKPRRSRVKEVHSPNSRITPPTSPAVSNSGGSVSQHSGTSSSHSSGGGKILEHQHSTASSKGLLDVAHHVEHASSGSTAVKAGENAAGKSLKNFHVTGKQATAVGGVLAAAGGATLLAHHLAGSNKQKRNEIAVNDEFAETTMKKRSDFIHDELLQKRSPGKGQLNTVLVAIGTGALAGGSYLAGYSTGKPAGVSKGAQREMKMRNSGGMGMGGGMYKRAIVEAKVEMAKREVFSAKSAQKAVMGVGAAGLVVGGFLAGRKHGKERGEADYNTQKLSRGGGGYYKRSFEEELQIVKRGSMSIHKKVLLAAGAATAAVGLTVPSYKLGKKDGKYSARKARNASSMQNMSAPMDNGSAPMKKRSTHKDKYELGKPQQYGKGNKLPLRSEVDDKMLY